MKTETHTYIQLVKDLGKVPGVAAALGQSKQGAEWLLRTWRGLLKVVEKHGKWSEEESRLVLDLLEIRAELRSGFLTILADDDKDGLILIVTEEMDRIEKRLESCVLACDDADRWLAAAGMPMEENEGTKRLRKQEGKLKLEYRRAKAELLESRAQAAAAAAGPRARGAGAAVAGRLRDPAGACPEARSDAPADNVQRGLELPHEAAGPRRPGASRDGGLSRAAGGRSVSVPGRRPRA